MAAQAVYLTGGEKIGLVRRLVASGVVQTGDSEREFRTKRAPMARMVWRASWVASKVSTVERLFELFENHTSFLLQPARTSDFTETAQVLRNTVTGLNVGDGSTATFQLQITRTLGSISGYKYVLHPRNPLTALRVDSVTKTEGVHFNVNYSTGIVTFTGGNIPASNKVVDGDFLWDTPVRFLSESIETVITQAYGSDPQQEISQVDLIEVFDE